jgi:hypothetical protein
MSALMSAEARSLFARAARFALVPAAVVLLHATGFA